MTLGELLVEIGVKVSPGTLKDFAKTIKDMPLDVAVGIASLIGLEFQLTKLAQEAMNTAVGFQMFTSQTGLSWQELQRWQIVAAQANVSTEAVATSVSALERNLADIRLGRGNIAPFQLLGINPHDSAFGVLSQLRSRIKNVDRPTAVNMISQMGLSPEMIQVLELTDQRFTQFMNHAHGMTERQYEDFTKARLSIVQFGQSFKEIMFEMISHFSAAIEKLLNFRKVMIGLGAVAAALAAFFFPVTAAIVGLILVLDDLATYFTGGQSLFGDAVAGIKKFGEELKNTPLQALADLFKASQLGFNQGLIPGVAGAAVGAAQSKSLQNIFNITVSGSGPASSIAQEVTRQVAKHFGKAEQEFNNQGH